MKPYNKNSVVKNCKTQEVIWGFSTLDINTIDATWEPFNLQETPHPHPKRSLSLSLSVPPPPLLLPPPLNLSHTYLSIYQHSEPVEEAVQILKLEVFCFYSVWN